jgi:hypothetical protein
MTITYCIQLYVTMYMLLAPPQCMGMDNSSYRRNFDLDKKNEIHYYSWKEHLKMSKVWLRIVVK